MTPQNTKETKEVKQKPKITGVVFDLDHTLFDRYATLRLCAPELLERFRECYAPGLTAEDLAVQMIESDKSVILYGWRKLWEEYARRKIFKDPPSYDEFIDYLMNTLFLKVAVPFPFTKPMLETLRKKGLKVGLITNAAGEKGILRQNAKLRLLGIADCFDKILISGEIGILKPDKEVFLEFSRRIGIPPENLAYVGDHPKNDVDGSRKAGYTPIWVKTRDMWLPDIEPCEYAVKDVSEIPALIDRINGGFGGFAVL